MSKSWRTSREYRVWRANVVRRDKTCVISGDRKTREAHHIEDGSNNPELRYDVNNGVTLARRYHTGYHTKFLRSFKCKCTKKTFVRFLKLVAIVKDVSYDKLFGRLDFLKM